MYNYLQLTSQFSYAALGLCHRRTQEQSNRLVSFNWFSSVEIDKMLAVLHACDDTAPLISLRNIHGASALPYLPIQQHPQQQAADYNIQGKI